MNCQVENTFPFRRWLRSCNARAGAPRLSLPKRSAFCWIDMSIRVLRKIASRFLPETRGRATRLVRSSRLSVRFRRSVSSREETSGRRKLLPIFFGKMASRLFRSFGWGSRILRNMDPRQERKRRLLRSNRLMKILLLSFRR